jgi:nucleoid-associated protein YgaU
MHPNESTPAIPRDAPVTATSPVIVVPPVVASATTTAEFTPRILPADSQPMDWLLWEQVWELKNESEAAPSNLRFDNGTATSEAAQRFIPIAEEAANQFPGLMPTSGALPNTDDIAQFLPILDNAPQPAMAIPMPAYREVSNQTNHLTNEKGMTFRSRIDLEISRSPSDTEMYIVQPGDTYMTISDKFYGTSLLYTALARHNQQLGIGWQPAEGVAIEIPTAEFLRMHYSETARHGERRLNVSQQTERYIVQEGDTVFRLATDRLRDSTRWREIYAMNADRLQNVHDLQAGMEILLPVEAKSR